MTAKQLVEQLDLLPHPEGGYYKEVYRSAGNIPAAALPGFGGARNYATSIYFLLEEGNFSALHRIKSDETWHFYAGDALEVIEIDLEGTLKTTLVGQNLEAGETFQYTVMAGHWFGSRVKAGGRFSLVGCTVAPGFDFEDFEMGERDALVKQYPLCSQYIIEMTR